MPRPPHKTDKNSETIKYYIKVLFRNLSGKLETDEEDDLVYETDVLPNMTHYNRPIISYCLTTDCRIIKSNLVNGLMKPS